MFAEIDAVLTPDELAKARMLISRCQFDDGGATSGAIAAGRKRNLQMRASGDVAREAAALIQRALLEHDEFARLAVPRRLHLAFNRYEQGMEYGPHFDAGVVGSGMERALRTDVSMTLFLNDPGDYDGGVLHIETPFGEQQAKLPAGSAILYPGNLRHWVTPVTRGARLAAFGWIQSMIRSPEQRRIVSDLNLVRRRLVETGADVQMQQTASNAYQNLMRQWAEL